MSNIIKKPYEISLWDDDLTFKYADNYTSTGKIVEGHGAVVAQYYKERKICIIGSDTMDTPIRAMNSKLISNVNGSNTLSFSMYSKYWDEDAEQFYDNPFLKLLVNERKVKVRYGALGSADCKWYDLIIKNVQENSETKTFDYTAKDMFVNELSKSGFEIVLDAELENNMGNITKLAEVVLDGSDWELGDGSSILTQTKEEPLYEIELNQPISAKDMQNGTTITISSGIIYAFYTPIVNKESYLQFLYVDGKYETDSDYVITNSPNWYHDGTTYNGDMPSFAKSMVISSEYRGDRIVRQIQTIYDSTIDKYVYSYNDGQYYGYTESEYLSPTMVRNFITNPNTFTSLSGWEVGGAKAGEANIYPILDLQGYPDPRLDGFNGEDYTTYLKYKATANNQVLFNSGITDHRSTINGFARDEIFVAFVEHATATHNNDGLPITITPAKSAPNIKIGTYDLIDGIYEISEIFELISSKKISEGAFELKFKSSIAMPYSEMITKKIGVFINFGYEASSDNIHYLKDLQLFKGIEKSEGVYIYPDDQVEPSVKTKYYYYIPNTEYKGIEDVQFIYEGYEPMKATQDYNDNEFEKVRSITAKESNRFNLIQTLCETFECWPKFNIVHNMQTGEIELDENYRQKKFLTFHEYIGKENHAGFRYGVNLKSIQRTLDSSGAVSKLVVKNNANEFADGGFCSIARASENPIGENYIYDFSYYIQQGLIGFSEINNDLYLDINGYLGYYKKLREYNKNRESWVEEQAGLLTDISDFAASYQTYKVSVESAEEEFKAVEIEIYKLTGSYYNQLIEDANNSWWQNNDLIAKINKRAQLDNTIKRHTILRDRANDNLKTAQDRFEELQELLDDIISKKKLLNLQFYKKYSRFIQEGSWIKEDYIDDNLYYLDAESTLHTSSQPKVTYNINVLELSQLPGYENYKFSLGDKTYMEDTEFFGWTYVGDYKVKTPYKEEIVVTELTVVFDSPEQNTIKVQNYKTQFEDLFQRITATTQSIEYHTGEYNRTTSIVKEDGTIVVDTLQNSIANNAIRLENAKDQTVVWDETGITTTSLSKPNEVVRLISGGVFMSTDGGITWNTGLTGSGINATYITSGQINTGIINIMNNGVPSFRWDGAGISAYEFQIDSAGQAYGFNAGKFVRFDQFGIYGINGYADFIATSEDSIWENAKYALTWKGFMLKNDDGSVRITSTDDIQVLQGETERIKIGRLEGVNSIDYGIRIRNDKGQTVMETDSNGELWLRNRLRVGTQSTSTVEIGYLEATRAETNLHEVIHAGKGEQEFIVYEDGKMVAQGAEFHGAIYATGGKIGNLTIGNVEDAVNNMDSITEATRKLDISSKLGYNFKVEDGISSPAVLELKATPIAFTINYSGISWFGSNDFESWVELADDIDTYTLTYEDFKNKQLNSTYYIKAVATATDGTSYEDWTTIMSISDGEKGEDAIVLVITSSGGNYFRNNQGSTILTARLFRAGIEIDKYETEGYTYIWSDPNHPSWSYTGKNLTVTAEDVNFNRTYVCDVSKGGK